MDKQLKTAKKANNKLVPLHKQIATGLAVKRKAISK
jgi:hypothetical protein